MSYTINRTFPNGDFEDLDARTRKALADNGFGVLTEIDVKATMKKKLDKDMPAYRILGACNPGMAWQAIGMEPRVGAMLPCNVIVEENEQGTLVRIVDPAAMMKAGGFEDDPALQEVGGEAGARLQRVADALSV